MALIYLPLLLPQLLSRLPRPSSFNIVGTKRSEMLMVFKDFPGPGKPSEPTFPEDEDAAEPDAGHRMTRHARLRNHSRR